eukprot:CAMPEP_0184483614 /NCGR_PEP_ID=MMETSP0113_2-20130426/5299_1 /TAXON_ID=91329 /ORGANISM="Norrisiella sphaerica, Strain BC52" /LENGTH=423 /DNA_ID=CAMNT_0026864149 /DNA_START=206 /DNA_END=1477 /DNA_ORIENTATION=-
MSFVLLKDYGWYIATGAIVAYLSYKAFTVDDLKTRRKKLSSRRENERLKRADYYRSASEAKSSKTSRRLRQRNTSSLENLPFFTSAPSPTPYDYDTRSSAEAKSYISSLVPRIEGGGPPFVPDSLKLAISIARVQNRPLFVFLEAPAADVTAQFAEEIFRSIGLTQFLASNFVCWAGTLRDAGVAEGYNLAKNLGVQATSESVLAILEIASDSREGKNKQKCQVRVLAMDTASFRSPEHVLQWAITAQDAWKHNVSKKRAEASRRHIVNEQNQEYEQALFRDEQQLEREKAQKLRIHQEHTAKAAAEKKEQLERNRRKVLRESFPKEPEAGGDGVVEIRFLFPDGITRAVRRFKLDEPAQILLEFLDSQEILDSDGKLIPTSKLRLVTRYPRKVISITPSRTIRQSNFSGPCVLCVEENLVPL